MINNFSLPKQFPQLNVLRFFAAVWVVFFHYFKASYGISVHIPILSDFINYGNLSVDFFFILSGFLLTHVEILSPSGSFIQFIKKRVLRIYPLYILALLFSVLVITQTVSVKAILVNLLSLQVFYPEYSGINTPAWTISQMFLFYLAFPFIYSVFKRNFVKVSAFIFLCSVFFLTDFFYLHTVWINVPQYIWLSYTFLLGISSRGILESPKVVSFFRKHGLNIFIVSLILFFVFVYFLRFDFFDGFIFINLDLCLLIISLSLLPIENFINRLLIKLSYLGNFSYSIFIFQAPLFNLFIKLSSKRPNLIFLIYFITLFLFSVVMYEFIEKPIAKWTKKL